MDCMMKSSRKGLLLYEKMDLSQAQGWQTYAVGLVTWVISFWLSGLIIRRRVEDEEEAKDAQ